MEKLDLNKILKVGDKVWSPILGECIVRLSGEDTNGHTILVATPDGQHDTTFNEEGKYFSYSPECTLFPSKDYRIWDDYAIPIIRQPKKGDYLVSPADNIFIYNGIGKYGRIAALFKHFNELRLGGNEENDNFTSIARYATPEEIKEFDEFLKSEGYYFDKENLELKKYRWRAKHGEQYWVIDSAGIVTIGRVENYTPVDDEFYNSYMYFKTANDARKAREQIRELLENFYNGNN